MNFSTNYVSDIIDEIALEGLDGITLDALWKRLSVRPNFCFHIDDYAKPFIWEMCTKLKDLTFYELPEKRKTLQFYNYSTIQKEQQDANVELDVVYPYSSIKNETGIFGSCQHYTTRKDITDIVTGMNLTKAEETFSDTLVIVASQKSRNLSLLGRSCPPNVDFSKSRMQYDILEKIGRCRSLGIPTHGKGSLQSIVEDSKSVFYYLKFLLKHKIIKKHSLLGSLQNNPYGSKIYLARYYSEYMNEYQAILQTAIEELKCRPNYRMSYEDFYQLFDSDKRARVKKYSKSAAFRKYIMVSKILPYREFFPNATQAEWERKCKFGEKMVRCYQLLDPNTEVADIFEKECDSEEDDANPSSEFLINEKYYKGIPLLHQAYFHVKNSGSHGVSVKELAEIMGLAPSYIRKILKRLIVDKHCKCFEEISGRRHTKRYIVGENAKNIAATCEIFEILSNNTDSGVNEKVENSELLKNNTCGTIAERVIDATVTTSDVDIEKKVEYQSLEDDNVPYRTLRRIGMIIKTIKAHRYRLFFQIYRYILDEEIKEGLTTTVCRTSVNRILQKLEKDKLIKIFDLSQKDDKSGTSVKLYTEPTFVLDEKLAETLLHTQSAYKTVDSAKILVDEDIHMERQLCDVLLDNLSQMKKMFQDINFKNDKMYPKETTKERELVCSPKFLRLNIIHDLMFYLVYDYTGISDKSQEELIRELSKTCEIDNDLKKDMPPIYGTQLTNYLFIPPLQGREGVAKGWFLMSDLLIRMPLSIYVKILRVPETTPELLSYLQHPIRKHFLIKDLPLSIRQTLFKKLQFNVSLFGDIRRLSFLGLLQFGVKCGKELYQTLLYLNQNATLLDTTSSPPSYLHVPSNIQFPAKRYKFDTRSDVKRYWQEMCDICLATNLGVKTNMIGKEVLAVRETNKEALRKVTEPKSSTRAVAEDDGTLPGDHLGAGGIDSVMFSFMRSNWIGPVLRTKDNLKLKPLKKVPLEMLKKEISEKKQRSHLYKSRLKKRFKKPEIIIPRPVVKQEKPMSNITRKVKERKFRFKRTKKTYYDEMDIEALRLKNTLRVTWSTAEDHLLLICKVAMTYLCPNPRVFYRIPWSEVRSNLQKHLIDSRNKTQKAIARRVNYIMKNPTTNRSVALCLEELNQIPEVAERFNCIKLMKAIKPSAPNLTELQNELYEKFHGLIDFMKERFDKGASFNMEKDEEDLLPDTVDQFLNLYESETQSVKEKLSLKNIRESVIRAILMSSLSCRADKTSSAIQLFDIYRQYEDDELQNTIKKLNSDKVIVLTKPNSSGLKAGKYLPLSHSPCKLSFSFRMLLNVKYAHSLYPDSFNMTNNLINCGDPNGYQVDLNECNVPLYVLACMDFISFRTTVPEQIIVLDSHHTMNNDAYAKMLKRYCEVLQLSNTDSKLVCTSGHLLTTLKMQSNTNSESNKRQADNSDNGADIKKLKLDCTSPSELRVDSSETKDTNVVDEKICEKTGSGYWRVVLYMMREEAEKEINNFSGNHSQEFFVVNASQVHCTLSSELKSYANRMDAKAVNAMIKNIVSRYCVPMSLVSEEVVCREFLEEATDQDVEMLKKVLEFIYTKREFGVTNEELRMAFKPELLPPIIRHLVDSKIVVKVGIHETCYIGQKYSTPWLLNSFKITRLEREKMKPSDLNAIELSENNSERSADDGSSVPKKRRKKGIISTDDLKNNDYVPPPCSMEADNKVKILIRPWLRIDGSLNRKVLDRFLGTILGFVMANPGITVRSVMERFSPSFIPVWTKDLLEILHEIGCIYFKTFIVKTKSTLFSKGEVLCYDNTSGLDEDDHVIVEAKVDAIIILGLFIGKKSYSKDFLAD